MSDGAQFDAFFRAATGNEPYRYQCRLACGPAADLGVPESLKSHAICESQLINIPTGLGKTAAVVVAWLWNRMGETTPGLGKEWPRRLVYCLPMRTLVEQTRDEVNKWIENLLKAAAMGQISLSNGAIDELRWLKEHSPVILMGGEESTDWDVYPERPAILIGTQDMLLSRALNRGYGMSRYRWPMHFGLLNNDCLWVMDETQLMGVGLETSAQMDGFRHFVEWSNGGSCPTWWMSATLDESRFATVDHKEPQNGWKKIELEAAERATPGVSERFESKKPAEQGSLILNSETKKGYAAELAKLIAAKHRAGTMTLVVVNRVTRAREVYAALKKLCGSSINPERIALIHSRFRPMDRARHTQLLFAEGDRIVIATQAVEAGVDVSARLLITELAPWSSLVQRIGRCNRRGELNQAAEVLWIDIQAKDEKDELVLPYAAEELKKGREAIQGLQDVGPQSLSGVRVSETPVIRPVIRRRDLLDLFDTTPDICGQDIDISRYIRDGEDNDVQFFWRAFSENSEPTNAEPAPCREELCRVSIGDAQKFLNKQARPARVWEWNSLEDCWQKVDRIRPGAVYLVDASLGGYDDDLGWTGEPKSKPTPRSTETGQGEFHDQDQNTFARYWLSLEEHTNNVVRAMVRLAEALQTGALDRATLGVAALWHDVGKAHPEFQKALRCGPCQPDDREGLYAKSENPYNPKAMAKERRGFRHELASALAWLSAAPVNANERDLIAFLIAAHHGKVRLSIRSLPEEKGDPANPERLFARGVWDRDILPSVPGAMNQKTEIDLRLMQMGDGEKGPSWLAKTTELRDRLGPMRLAYLEMLLRAADMRASSQEAREFAEQAAPSAYQNQTSTLEP
ncbi:MAG: uncharacterized protein JWM16_1884 [Verrucomicrobiales bacterium]|nr:uncharacterized protein [Verrucomicrobiales bacterium]